MATMWQDTRGALLRRSGEPLSSAWYDEYTANGLPNVGKIRYATVKLTKQRCDKRTSEKVGYPVCY